jgi:hypothetical protein
VMIAPRSAVMAPQRTASAEIDPVILWITSRHPSAVRGAELQT